MFRVTFDVKFSDRHTGHRLRLPLYRCVPFGMLIVGEVGMPLPPTTRRVSFLAASADAAMSWGASFENGVFTDLRTSPEKYESPQVSYVTCIEN